MMWSGQILPCMPAKWASPRMAAIHNSWESTSDPTRWYPGGTCTMAFSSLPTRSGWGHKNRPQKRNFSACYRYNANLVTFIAMQTGSWMSDLFREVQFVCRLGLSPEHYWQSAMLAPQPDALLFQRWWPEAIWHHTGPLHRTLCVFGRQKVCYIQQWFLSIT